MAKEGWEKIVDNKEKFMEVSKEVWPLILEIREIMAKHKLPDNVYITVGTDGYTEFKPLGMGWDLHTYSFDQTPKARCEYSEEIALEEVQV